MSALREFSDFVKTHAIADPQSAADLKSKKPRADVSGATVATVDKAADTEDTEDEAEVTELLAEIEHGLAALTGPYNEAVAANNSPDAQELKKVFGAVKTSLAKRDLEHAAEALASLEDLLGKQSDAPRLPGIDTGLVKADVIGDIGKIIDPTGPFVRAGKAIKNKLYEQRDTTIIIENETSKELQHESDDRTDKKHTEWSTQPPTRIEPAKNGKPGKATMVVKTKGLRGGKKGDTSGSVV